MFRIDPRAQTRSQPAPSAFPKTKRIIPPARYAKAHAEAMRRIQEDALRAEGSARDQSTAPSPPPSDAASSDSESDSDSEVEASFTTTPPYVSLFFGWFGATAKQTIPPDLQFHFTVDDSSTSPHRESYPLEALWKAEMAREKEAADIRTATHAAPESLPPTPEPTATSHSYPFSFTPPPPPTVARNDSGLDPGQTETSPLGKRLYKTTSLSRDAMKRQLFRERSRRNRRLQEAEHLRLEDEARRDAEDERRRAAAAAAERKRAAMAAQRQREADAEAQLQREADAQRQREAEAQRQELAAQRQREADAEIQRLREIEAHRLREAEVQRQREFEEQRQREAKEQRQREAEVKRQRLAAAHRQREAELQQQREAEAQRQRDAEAQRQRAAAAQRQREADEQEECQRQAESERRTENERRRRLEEQMRNLRENVERSKAERVREEQARRAPPHRAEHPSSPRRHGARGHTNPQEDAREDTARAREDAARAHEDVRRRAHRLRREESAFKRMAGRWDARERHRSSASSNSTPLKRTPTPTAHLTPRERYDILWTRLLSPPTADTRPFTFASFPWPGGRTLVEIAKFLLSGVEGGREKQVIRQQLKRWHPDKFAAVAQGRVVDSDRERVLEGQVAVVLALNGLLGRF